MIRTIVDLIMRNFDERIGTLEETFKGIVARQEDLNRHNQRALEELNANVVRLGKATATLGADKMSETGLARSPNSIVKDERGPYL